jgi:hypothetical protein
MSDEELKVSGYKIGSVIYTILDSVIDPRKHTYLITGPLTREKPFTNVLYDTSYVQKAVFLYDTSRETELYILCPNLTLSEKRVI